MSDFISLDQEWPTLGQKVILFSNGVVQNETFEFDQCDSDFGGGDYFWQRDDLDECPIVDFEKDQWMPLPETPEVLV